MILCPSSMSVWCLQIVLWFPQNSGKLFSNNYTQFCGDWQCNSVSLPASNFRVNLMLPGKNHLINNLHIFPAFIIKSLITKFLNWKYFTASWSSVQKLSTGIDEEVRKYHHHHHQVTLIARSSPILSDHPSLLSISSGRSFRLHPVSAQTTLNNICHGTCNCTCLK